MLAVTSFHPEGFEKYGRRCLEGLAEFFPGRIVAYHEELPPELNVKVDYRDLFSIPGLNPFLERIKRVAGANGYGHDGYDYRYDCNKFCRKVFAQDAVFDEDEYVFWIDADTVVKQEIREGFLKEIFEGTALAYMGRNTYTETGFVGFHTKHPDFERFRKNYLPWITSGKIFGQLKGWHDCIAFDQAREGLKGRNLTPRGRNYDPVMVNSVLHPFLDHLKGNRKHDGKPPRVKWT